MINSLPRILHFELGHLFAFIPLVTPGMGFFLLFKADLAARGLFLRWDPGEHTAEEDLIHQVVGWSGALLLLASILNLVFVVYKGHMIWLAVACAGIAAGSCLIIYPSGVKRWLKHFAGFHENNAGYGIRMLGAGLCLVGFVCCTQGVRALIQSSFLFDSPSWLHPLPFVVAALSRILFGAILVLLAARLARTSWGAHRPELSISRRQFSPAAALQVVFPGAATYLLVILTLHVYRGIIHGWTGGLLWMIGGIGGLVLSVRYARKCAFWLSGTSDEGGRGGMRMMAYIEVTIGVVVLYLFMPRLGRNIQHVAEFIVEEAFSAGAKAGPVFWNFGLFPKLICLVVFLFKADLAHRSVMPEEKSTCYKEYCACLLRPWLIVLGAAFIVRSLSGSAGSVAQWVADPSRTVFVYAGSGGGSDHPVVAAIPWLGIIGAGMMVWARELAERLCFGRLVPGITEYYHIGGGHGDGEPERERPPEENMDDDSMADR
jgi:hypothetical protein